MKILSKVKILFLSKKFNSFGKKSIIGKRCILRNHSRISVGNNVKIYDFCRIECFDSYFEKKFESSIIIGDNVFINRYCTILSAGQVIIKSNSTLASGVVITNENHGTNPEIGNYLNQDLIVKDVLISEGCWIGENVIILPGVEIGRNTIIGAGSVVTKPIPDFSIACGNPARVIKRWDFTNKCWIKI